MTRFIKSTKTRFAGHEEMIRNTNATVRNLEHQVAQISTLPSNTMANPKESLKGVTLRDGKQLQNLIKKEPKLEVAEPIVTTDMDTTKKDKTAILVYPQKLPFPAKARKDQPDEQYKKFLDICKTLYINVPLVEALAQMLWYAKFLKELLTNKRKLEDVSSVTLSEEFSALLCNKLPKREKDPGGFIVPCTIGGLVDEKALADLGASINLMLYRIFHSLGLGKPNPINTILQLADRSTR
ncbi:uncharacterized protein LOC120267328 [Dioscorea cayenensis subsp. rotundata]|uniref:Uncharacterized protein LOC120267328 n=1 Tax=Dioscorea cayennensis subsp. rotundata TaxID=55577 RepID=A0AB40BW88_DIOCR|nr:uncharacterized protein LOC120267328 [Dioscorea cayenensis subsp. rotundata]